MSKLRLLRMVCPVAFLVLVWVDVSWLNVANTSYARHYLDESIGLSVGTYAMCRIINGGVSSIQESSVSISPWGIGVDIEAGQVLDPINDATERLSDVCVKAMALLGVQRLLLGVVNAYTIYPFYLLLALFLFALSFLGKRPLTLLLGQGALLLLLVRLSTPALCLIGSAVNQNYFSPRIAEEQAKLRAVKEIAMAEFEAELPVLTTGSTGAEGRFVAVAQFLADFRDRIVAISGAIQHRASSLAHALAYLRTHFEEVSRSLAELFVLVIEKIIVQVFLLPLALLYLLKRIYAGVGPLLRSGPQSLQSEPIRSTPA
jgi:hypothetical protein